MTKGQRVLEISLNQPFMIYEDCSKWCKLPIRIEIDFVNGAREGEGNHITSERVMEILNTIKREAEVDHYAKNVNITILIPEITPKIYSEYSAYFPDLPN